MGKTYSKNEEIIIAQNGANQLDFTNVESHIKNHYYIAITVLLLIIIIICYLCCGKCTGIVKKCFRKEMDSVIQKQRQQV